MFNQVTASAPASIGNVGVGYDVLGQAFDAARDYVTAVREPEPGVRLGTVTGLVTSLPDAPEKNCALAGPHKLLADAGADFGARLSVDKGVPMSAGMGGSAASAVAGVVAVNALLPRPLPLAKLLPYALEGERVSADPPPWDNVIAALFGGLVMVANEERFEVHPLPSPRGVTTVLFHPDAKIETAAARALLQPQVPMKTAVEHSRRLAAFIAGCTTGNIGLIRSGFEDLLVEPQRSPLLPALAPVKAAAMEAGALGCSFSGSGPSVFAWALDHDADRVEAAMAEAFLHFGLGARAYRGAVDSAGARVESPVAGKLQKAS